MSKVYSLVAFFLLVVAIGCGLFYFYYYVSPQHELSAKLPQSLTQSANAEAFVLPITQPNYLPIRDFNVAEPIINAKASGLYDVEADKFLYTAQVTRHLPIASITKLMTSVVVREHFDLNKVITITKDSVNVDGNGADLNVHEQLTGHDLLRMMLIKSSNDAAYAFAHAAQEQSIDLVTAMNDKAKELGMYDTKFLDPAGLDDTAYSTVEDLVRLTRYIATKHHDLWSIMTTPSDDIIAFDGTFSHHIVNTDQLLGQIPHIIGGKTGFTNLAMGTMLLVVSQENDTLISVVLGTKDRFAETKHLIDWAKTAYRWE